jgi:hypothetical protein
MTVGASEDVAADLEDARRLLLDGVDAMGLYRRWFHRETGSPTAWPESGAYRTAILDPARFETGWRVLEAAARPAGAVVALRGGRHRVVAPPEMVPDDARNLAPGRGSTVRVFPLASGEAGGFWHLWSAGWQVRMPEQFVRLYCHVSPRRALDFAVLVATTAPPRPTWAMKALCGVHDSGRRDRALVYLPGDAALDTGWVARLIAELRTCCDGGMPPLVEPIAPGIGWAPDPGGGRSFGEAVSAAVASAADQASDRTRFAAAALAAVRVLPGMDRSPLARAHR